MVFVRVQGRAYGAHALALLPCYQAKIVFRAETCTLTVPTYCAPQCWQQAQSQLWMSSLKACSQTTCSFVYKMQVAINQSFRPGDLIRARVLALGTMREYRLTTAEPELGVVFARSLAGATLATPVRCNAVNCGARALRRLQACRKSACASVCKAPVPCSTEVLHQRMHCLPVCSRAYACCSKHVVCPPAPDGGLMQRSLNLTTQQAG